MADRRVDRNTSMYSEDPNAHDQGMRMRLRFHAGDVACQAIVMAVRPLPVVAEVS
jgi:hypothetical protein